MVLWINETFLGEIFRILPEPLQAIIFHMDLLLFFPKQLIVGANLRDLRGSEEFLIISCDSSMLKLHLCGRKSYLYKNVI